jgi:hypothetical protein
MSWPTAYRAGAGAYARGAQATAQTLRSPGFQGGVGVLDTLLEGAAVSSLLKSAVSKLPRDPNFYLKNGAGLLGAAVVSVAAVELYRAYQGARANAYAGWTKTVDCGVGEDAFGPWPINFSTASCGTSATVQMKDSGKTTTALVSGGVGIVDRQYWQGFEEAAAVPKLTGGVLLVTGKYGTLYTRKVRVFGTENVGLTTAPMTVAIPRGQRQPIPGVLPPVPVVAGRGPPTTSWPQDRTGGQPTWVAPGEVTGTLAWTLTATSGATVPYTRSVPKTLTKETKVRMSRQVGAMVHAFNEYTEFQDFVDALYKAIPKGACKAAYKSAGQQPTSAQKEMAVYACFKQINLQQAIFNVMWQNVTDRIWAMIGLPTKEAGMAYGTNAPINIALGHYLSKPVGNSLKYVEQVAKDFFNGEFGLGL